jgi:hypothetical protein
MMFVRNNCKVVVILSIFFVGTVTASITPEDIDFEVTADYYGKYIWRGQNLSDDPVIQPGASVSFAGFTASWWSNIDTTKINGNNGKFTEHDWSLDYSGDIPGLEGVGYSVGVIRYFFPNLNPADTTEVYWGLGFDLPLSPSITVYHDVDEAKGTYVSLGLSHSFEKFAVVFDEIPVGLDLSANLGWANRTYNKYYWAANANSERFNDLAFSIAFPFELFGLSLTPSLNYVTLVDSRVSKSNTYNKDDTYFVAGISVGKSF